ncbi:hypothetical protein M9H77_08136 [Catharanthus roseus]|uniref:Uncharacterized protein n=1 Tax=Catharanthus roseus TaxID=4058 RepID=A0ACC0BX84_CATRO|nr:hypothetical protein M9H77_08136 [Catharanthus roseus]
MPWSEMTVTLHDVELILSVPAYGRAVDLHYSRDQTIAVIQSDLGTVVRPHVLMQRSWLGVDHYLMRYGRSLTSFKRSEIFGFPHGTGCLRISIALRRTCLIELSDSSGGVNAFRHILFNPKSFTAQLHHRRLFTVVHSSQSSQDTESRECFTWFSCSSSCMPLSALMGMIVREIDRDDAGKEERFDRITELVKLYYRSSY